MQRQYDISLMKKIVKWIGIAVITPILLFIILAVLLCLPPVQNWAVKKVAAIASEKTGMEITVEHVSLEFPLNLGIEGLRALHPNDSLPQVTDTIADIGKMVVNVRLRPLFDKQIIINELSLQQAKVNTNGFISDLRIKGNFDELWLSSKGIDLNKETAEINGARLKDARLDINLTDTAAVDTTSTPLKWIINADSLCLSRTELKLHLPGDSLNIETHMGHAVARGATIDIGQSIYKIADLDWQDGYFNYNNSIKQEFTQLAGEIKIDSTSVDMPRLKLRTPDSDVEGELAMDFNTFDDLNPGKMKARLNAQIGKQDLVRLMGDMPQKFIQRYPNSPLSIKGSLNGNLQNMDFTGLVVNLPSAFQMTANGTIGNVTDLQKMKADIQLSAKTQDMNFVTALVDPKLTKNYRIPNGMTLDGTIKADGTNYDTNLTLRDGKGSVKMKGLARIPVNAKGDMVTSGMTYDADIRVNQLNLHRFMPNDSIYTVTANIKAKGYGTDFLSSRSRLTADANVSHLHYGSWNLTDLTAKATLRLRFRMAEARLH